MNKRSKIFFILFILVCGVFSQTTDEKIKLEKEKEALKKKISDANNLLNKISKDKESTLYQLRLMNQKISAKEAYVQLVNDEIIIINQEIILTEDIISGMEHDIDTLKHEYAEMVYQAQKINDSFDKLSYIYASKSFNELSLKLQYMKQFNEARKNQVLVIKKMLTILEEERASLKNKKTSKLKLIAEVNHEKVDLESLKIEKSSHIQSLSSKEAEHQKEIKKWEKQKKDIEEKIKELIKIINERAAKSVVSSKDIAIKSKEFAANQGRLNWPVIDAVVTRHHGRQRHPTLNVYEDILGVMMAGTSASSVRSVFDGKVSIVASVGGGNGKTVIISHGNYLTIYNNLTNVTVKANQAVTAKQSIGKIRANKHGNYELDFQIWKNVPGQEPLIENPEKWLHK